MAVWAWVIRSTHLVHFDSFFILNFLMTTYYFLIIKNISYIFNLFFMFLSSSYAACLCRRLVRHVVCVILIRRFCFQRLVVAFSCVWVV